MKIKDLKCDLKIAEKLKRRFSGKTETSHCLPPGYSAESHAVDEYPACPSNWMNGSDIASSYFVVVEKDKGMWLNFNECDDYNYDVAVVVSIQGINPITGINVSSLSLEQYREKCPVHGISFKQDRYCEECKFKWPSQNYITTTSTPRGYFWLDGFRRPDGSVRQYVFTEERIKGVAAQMIGDDRVYAIGIAFYLSKKPKEKTEREPIIRDCSVGGDLDNNGSFKKYIANWNGDKFSLNTNIGYCSSQSSPSTEKFGSNGQKNISPEMAMKIIRSSCEKGSSNISENIISCRGAVPDVFNEPLGSSLDIVVGASAADSEDYEDKGGACSEDQVPEITEEETTTLEVGAGAKINQEIYEDPKDLDYWEEKPYGLIYINYCTKETAEKIIKDGKRKDKEEGFLQSLEVTD